MKRNDTFMLPEIAPHQIPTTSPGGTRSITSMVRYGSISGRIDTGPRVLRLLYRLLTAQTARPKTKEVSGENIWVPSNDCSLHAANCPRQHRSVQLSLVRLSGRIVRLW